MKTHKPQIPWQRKAPVYAMYGGLLLYAGFTLLPFWWMLTVSFKDSGALFKIPPSFAPDLLFSDDPLANYKMVVQEGMFLYYLRNSLFVSFMAAVGQVFTCSLAGYAFGRMQWRFRNLLYAIIIGTMFIPNEVIIIPEFLLMRQLNWLDTFLPLIVPSFLVGAFGLLMMRDVFSAIPHSLEKSAIMDGAGIFQRFYYVILPNAKPALASLFVIAFISNWDELLRPILYITDPYLKTLPQGLLAFVGQYDAEWAPLMAGSVISVMPLVIIYIAAQKYIVAGFVNSGIK